MTELAVIVGDGQMGLVLADALAIRGVDVRIWGPIASDAIALRDKRESFRLPGLRLNDQVAVTSDDALALEGATVIVSAIPNRLRPVWKRLGPHVPAGVPIVSVSKGIEIDTLLRPTQVITEMLDADLVSRSTEPTDQKMRLCVLSGPSIAAELARRQPATLVAASADSSLASRVQDLLRVPWLRIYRHDDVTGVEVAGATKNVIALAAGMVDGLKAGDNAKSALLARGLAEIARLGMAMGARIDTFFGVAGVGDLATTCFSPEGRNRSCGERLASGEPLDSILKSMQSVVEGVPTTRAVMTMAAAHRIEMPITAAVHAILFEGKAPREAIRDLMNRGQKAEHVG